MVVEWKRGREDEPGPSTTVQNETDSIIIAALKDERRERRQKMEQTRGDAKGDYLSDSDVEESDDDEGDQGVAMRKSDDPIQEDMVDMAHAKRRALRKGSGMDEENIGLVADIQRAEEGYEIRKEVEKEHGIALEAFNLVEERERGYFDKEGNYVERAPEEEEGEEEDAWLADGQDKDIVDDVTRKKIEDRMKQSLEEDNGDMSAVDIARIQYKISDILQQGESVAVALKRLAGPTHRRKNTRDENKNIPAHSQDQIDFDLLTEYATILLDAGETDVYVKDKAYFQRAASVYIDIDDDDIKLFGQRQSLSSEDESEDMFASDSEPDPNLEKRNKKQKKEGTDFSDWPIKEIKRFCEEHGKTCTGITEKEDLVHLACEVERDLAERVQKAASANTDEPMVTNGAIFDSKSGHWMSQDRLFFWDQTQQSWKPTNK